MKTTSFLKFNKSLLIVFISVFFGIFSCSKDKEEAPAIKKETSIDLPVADTNPNDPGIGEVKAIKPMDFVSEMGVGWNLGNSFDWDKKNKATLNPLPTKSTIDKVANAGFKTIRIPVTWRWHQSESSPYKLELDFLKDIKKIVDYALANKMHVIINTHHDTEVYQPSTANEATATKRLVSTWKQIATFFKNYNEKLIFEILNEPRVKGNSSEWNAGTEKTRRVLNNFHKAAVEAIRATDKNNTKRQIMISPWAGKTNDTAMNSLIIPNDDPNIIITVHTYYPFDFAHNGKGNWRGEADLTDLRNELDRIKTKWIDQNNRPVILGEWGITRQDDKTTEQERIDYAKIYAKEAAKRGLLTVLWDDGGWFGLLNRNTLEWESQKRVDAIINSSK